MPFARLILLVIALLALAVPAAAGQQTPAPTTTPSGGAKQTTKKAMWGPTTVNGKSAFPIYKDLGVGIWQVTMRWYDVAPTKPGKQTNPKDPAYQWPTTLGPAVRAAKRNGIKVLVSVSGAPGWANGGRDVRHAPNRAKTFKRFLAAAAKRFRGVKYWMIWGEPTRRDNFRPLVHETRDRRLNRKQRKGPRRYAQLLDAAYAGIKSVQRKDKVIGGNTFTTGDVSTKNWVRYVKLPNGKSPRMDMWGHNPFGPRKPDLSDPPLGHGFVDFGTLDTLARWLDRHQRRGGRKRIFISEYTLPTDHANHEFNYYAPRKVQAQFVTAALRITRRWKRIASFGWHELLDEAPRNANGGAHGDETHRGLMTYQGKRKRAYKAFKRG